MKFVCDKCGTKYTISDEKVRRKVLKIRCKNCSSIIVVREPGAPSTEVPPLEPAPGRPPEDSFDPSFRVARPVRVSGQSSALRSSPSVVTAPAAERLEEPAAEPTRLTSLPDFMGGETPGGPPLEDEWYLAVEGAQFGPMGFSELCSRVRRGEAAGEAFVWRDGFDDWLELHDVPELKPFLPRIPPPPPRGKSGLFPVTAALGPIQSPVSSSPYLSRVTGATMPPLPAGSTLPPGAALSSPALPVQSPTQVQPYRGHGSLPPGTPAPPLPMIPPALVDPTGPLGDSGLGPLPVPPGMAAASLPLPGSGATLEGIYPVVQPAPAPVRPTSSTPLLLKVTAVAGVLSLLCGIGLLVYFIFLDGPEKPPRVAIPIAAAPDPEAVVQPEPAPAPVAEPPQEFQPMEISRSDKEPAPRRVAPRKVPKPAPAPAAAAPSLNAKQKALLALYGKGEAKPAEAPAPKLATKTVSSPGRQISENDILAQQRKHRTALTACYDRALKRDDTLAELKAQVEVTTDANGATRSAIISGVRDDELVNCLRKNIKYWVFPGVGEQTFRFPIIFRGT